MTLIGMISDDKSFQAVKEEIKKQKRAMKLFHINKKSITNLRNIQFEMLIINSDISQFSQESKAIKEICKKAKYIMINSDLNEDFSFSKEMISYGLNQKAIVTISSITESNVLIYQQKELKNKEGRKLEVGERRIEIGENSKLKIYEILILDLIFSIEGKP